MLMILTGMSGSGKDAVQRELTSPDNNFEFERLITVTTRPMRESEENGVDYYFISDDEFAKGIEKDRFIEYRSYNTLVDGKPDTWYYGSVKQELNPDKDYCIILDMQGAKAFTEYYGKENCFVVEILVDDKIREERAMARGSFDKTEWDRRLADDRMKFAPSETENIVNYTADNSYNDLDDTVYAILEACDAYCAYEKEKGRHYLVEETMLNNGYYDPPESEFRVYDAERLRQAEMEEERFAIEHSLSDCLAEVLPENYNIEFVTLTDEKDENCLFTALVNIGYYGDKTPDSATFIVAPLLDGEPTACSYGMTDDEIVIGKDLPFEDFVDKYEEIIIEALEKGVGNWMKENEHLIKQELSSAFKDYTIEMNSDATPCKINELSEENLYRLSAELQTFLDKKMLTKEQEAYLGSYNPYHNSEILVNRGNDNRFALVELFLDEAERLKAYVNLTRDKDYQPELPKPRKDTILKE